MKALKHELQNLLSGKGDDGTTRFITSITSYLASGKAPSTTPENEQFSKEQEEKKLTDFIEANQFWYTFPLDEKLKIGAGAEQIVYYW